MEALVSAETTVGSETTDFWQDRRTLVTGASGLLGGWTVRRLLGLGADVVCIVRDWTPQSELFAGGLAERCAVVRGDVRDHTLVERVLGEYEVAAVLHLAAQTIVEIARRNPLSTLETNVGGTWSVLEACRRSPTVGQVVVASSDKAYGRQPVLPYTEDMPLLATHPYDASKACADLIALSYARTYDLPVAVTRCGNFFGGGDLNWSRIVPGTVRSVLRGRRPVIRSDGRFVRDYLYVEDGAAANTLLAEQLSRNPACRGQAFNFSTETPVDVLTLVGRILGLMGSDLEPVVLDEARHEIPMQYLSAGKARATLSWRPLFDLDEGLERTISWYEKALAAA